jgi:hypothetical protein
MPSEVKKPRQLEDAAAQSGSQPEGARSMGLCERRHARLQPLMREYLSRHWFLDLDDVRFKVNQWRFEYCEVRPHWRNRGHGAVVLDPRLGTRPRCPTGPHLNRSNFWDAPSWNQHSPRRRIRHGAQLISRALEARSFRAHYRRAATIPAVTICGKSQPFTCLINLTILSVQPTEAPLNANTNARPGIG